MLSYINCRRRGGDFKAPGRFFCPPYESLHRRISQDQLLVYDSAKGVHHIQEQAYYAAEPKVDAESLVLSIGGTCRSPGIRGARAAWSVYFGPGSPYNTSAILDPALPQTEARAEIEALQKALNIIETNIMSDDFRPRRCFIKTHSSYLQRVFPSLVHRWAADGGKNVFGEKVVFFELLADIVKRLDNMGVEEGKEGGTDVLFWRATQEDNKEADGLAVDALAQLCN